MVMRQLLIFLIFFQFSISYAQQGVLWAKIHGDDISRFPERAKSIGTDDSKNVYVGGQVNTLFVRDSNGHVIQSQANPNIDSLYNNGGKDAWVSSYTKEGDHRWTRYAGSGNDDDFYSLLVASNGDCIISGRITPYSSQRPPRIFGGLQLQSNQVGTYIAKLNSMGDLEWYTSFGGDTISNNFIPYGSAVINTVINSDQTISCFMYAGYDFSGPNYQTFFDKDSLDYGIYEAVFDASGNYLRVNRLPFSSRPNRQPNIISLSKEYGKIVIAGIVDQDTVFVANDTLIKSGLNDGVLFCFDTAMNYLWSFKSANHFDQFFNNKITSDSIIVSGHFDISNNRTVTFDSISYTGTSFINQAAGIFTFDAKDGKLLSLLPSKSRGFAIRVYTQGVAVNSNFLAIGGLFRGDLTFSGTSSYITAVDNCNNCTNNDIFFAVFNRDGSFFLEDVIYSSGNSGEGVDVLHLVDSTLYIAGLIGDSILIPDVDTLYARGNNDAFIAAYRLSFTTSIQENPKIIKASNGILAYPNPTEGNIRLLGKPLGDIAYLYNISGQLLREYRVSTRVSNQALDLNNLNTGIYMLIIPGSNGSQQLKIIKQ